jgi:hypothetical protein
LQLYYKKDKLVRKGTSPMVGCARMGGGWGGGDWACVIINVELYNYTVAQNEANGRFGKTGEKR